MAITSEWTASFPELRESIELYFDPLDVFETNRPDLYVRAVLAEGFNQYTWKTGLPFDIIGAIYKRKLGFDPDDPDHRQMYYAMLKTHYYHWARVNKIPQNKRLLEAGWSALFGDGLL